MYIHKSEDGSKILCTQPTTNNTSKTNASRLDEILALARADKSKYEQWKTRMKSFLEPIGLSAESDTVGNDNYFYEEEESSPMNELDTEKSESLEVEQRNSRTALIEGFDTTFKVPDYEFGEYSSSSYLSDADRSIKSRQFSINLRRKISPNECNAMVRRLSIPRRYVPAPKEEPHVEVSSFTPELCDMSRRLSHLPPLVDRVPLLLESRRERLNEERQRRESLELAECTGTPRLYARLPRKKSKSQPRVGSERLKHQCGPFTDDNLTFHPEINDVSRRIVRRQRRRSTGSISTVHAIHSQEYLNQFSKFNRKDNGQRTESQHGHNSQKRKEYTRSYDREKVNVIKFDADRHQFLLDKLKKNNF